MPVKFKPSAKKNKKKKHIIVPDEDTFRNSIIDIFEPILKSVSSANELEAAIYQFTMERYSYWGQLQFRNTYRAKVRSIKFNLTNKNNPNFVEQVLNKKIPVSSIPFMKSYEIFPELYESIFEKVAQKNLKEKFDTNKKVCGLFTCEKCKSKETTYYEMQTRSADEPMTAFITCITCENRWKI